MRIGIRIPDGRYNQIDSESPKAISEWLLEQLANLKPFIDNAALMRDIWFVIYPGGEFNQKYWDHYVHPPIDIKTLQWVMNGFMLMAQGKKVMVVEATEDAGTGQQIDTGHSPRTQNR